jgi:hypothetical protein
MMNELKLKMNISETYPTLANIIYANGRQFAGNQLVDREHAAKVVTAVQYHDQLVEYIQGITAEVNHWRTSGKPDITKWLELSEKGEKLLIHIGQVQLKRECKL